MFVQTKRKLPPCTPYKPPLELNFGTVTRTGGKYNSMSDVHTPSNGAHVRKKMHLFTTPSDDCDTDTNMEYASSHRSVNTDTNDMIFPLDNDTANGYTNTENRENMPHLPSPLMTITPSHFKTCKKTPMTLLRRGGAFDFTPEPSPRGTPTKRNILFSASTNNPDYVYHTSVTKPSTYISTPCPPTPCRTPSWMIEEVGGTELVRKSSLCSTKVLITLPWDTDQFPNESDFLFSNEFDNLGIIGTGASYEVYHVRDKFDGKDYAVKRSKRIFRSKNDRELYLDEVKAYQKLGPQCDHIIQYYRAWQEEGYFYLQTEFCERGNLKEFVSSLDRPVPESTIWSWLLEICIGLKHLHEHDLVHLDVKTENIFLTVYGELKLGDLGMVRECTHDEDGWEGDTQYMALELLNSSKKHPSADIFSLGILLYEVASGTQPPKEGLGWHAFREDQVPSIPGRSNSLNKMISALTQSDPTKRPSAIDILAHPMVIKASKRKDDFVVSTPIKTYTDSVPIRSSDDMDLVYSRGKSSSMDFMTTPVTYTTVPSLSKSKKCTDMEDD